MDETQVAYDNRITSQAPIAPEATEIFPQVAGRNLRRDRVELPRDFGPGLTVVFVAFQQWQQGQVDSWLPAVKELQTAFPSLDFLELPVISDRSGIWQLFINEGMRAGIPDPATRQRTVTLYLDKGEFRRQLSLPDEQDIYILLVDPEGRLRWTGRGRFSELHAGELAKAIESLLAN